MESGSPLLAAAVPNVLRPARSPALAGDVLPSLERTTIWQSQAPRMIYPCRGMIYLLGRRPGVQPPVQTLLAAAGVRLARRQR